MRRQGHHGRAAGGLPDQVHPHAGEVSEFDRGIESSCNQLRGNSDGNLHHGGGGSTLGIDEPAGPEIQFAVGLRPNGQGGWLASLLSSDPNAALDILLAFQPALSGRTNECTVVTNYSGTILQVGTRQGLATLRICQEPATQSPFTRETPWFRDTTGLAHSPHKPVNSGHLALREH